MWYNRDSDVFNSSKVALKKARSAIIRERPPLDLVRKRRSSHRSR
jgi:hypothetical protein